MDMRGPGDSYQLKNYLENGIDVYRSIPFNNMVTIIGAHTDFVTVPIFRKLKDSVLKDAIVYYLVLILSTDNVSEIYQRISYVAKDTYDDMDILPYNSIIDIPEFKESFISCLYEKIIYHLLDLGFVVTMIKDGTTRHQMKLIDVRLLRQTRFSIFSIGFEVTWNYNNPEKRTQMKQLISDCSSFSDMKKKIPQ